MSKPIRILLVDDSPYFLAAARDFLHLHKTLEVTGIAAGGQEALAQARQTKPDVILLDLNLGSESGLELIPHFKQHVPTALIIILTILPDESYRAAALQAGADAFVPKTEINRTLIPTIQEVANDREPQERVGSASSRR
jgi:DNA-binding NarL/FixJ family response regulator